MRSTNGRKWTAAVALAALVSGGAALADRGWKGAPPAEVLARFDANKNGTLEDAEKNAMHEQMKAEHEKRRAETLQKFDANRDGKLDDAERTRAREERTRERFTELDTNKDGALSLSEFQAGKQEKQGHHGRRGHGRF